MMNIFAEIKKPGYRPGHIINILKKDRRWGSKDRLMRSRQKQDQLIGPQANLLTVRKHKDGQN